MGTKARLKIIIDVLMTLVLLFLMGYQFWGEAPHEWAGAGMFALFIIHHVLNWGWYKSMFRGGYTPFRMFQLIVNSMIFASMLCLMISGMMLSNYVFAFLDIHDGISMARLIHMASSYWGFILMALHLGLHWQIFIGSIRKRFTVKHKYRASAAICFCAGAGIAVWGITAFLRRDLLTYMLVRTQFVFFDFSEPEILFYIDYLAMMGSCIFLAHYAGYLLRHRQRKHKI